MRYPALYLGPVYYFARLLHEPVVEIETREHYTKQTFRNRCLIAGPNGAQALSIPVKRIHGRKNEVRDIRIDYDTPWQKIHWKSLEAAYASSPFYEFILDDLHRFYYHHFAFLLDFNVEIMEMILEILDLDKRILLSRTFSPIESEADPRQFIHPKKEPREFDASFHPVPYHQVFMERNGFLENLSIIDLISNEGPAAVNILKGSLRSS